MPPLRHAATRWFFDAIALPTMSQVAAPVASKARRLHYFKPRRQPPPIFSIYAQSALMPSRRGGCVRRHAKTTACFVQCWPLAPRRFCDAQS